MASSVRNKLILSYIVIIVSMIAVAGVLLVFLLRSYQVQLGRTRLGERSLLLSAAYNDSLTSTLRQVLEDEQASIISTYNSFGIASVNARERPRVPQVIRDVSTVALDRFYTELDVQLREMHDINMRVLLVGSNGIVMYDSNNTNSLRGQRLSELAADNDRPLATSRMYIEGSLSYPAGAETYIYGATAFTTNLNGIGSTFFNPQRQDPAQLRSAGHVRLVQEHLRSQLPRYLVLLRPQHEVESLSEIVPPLVLSSAVALLVALVLAYILSRSIADPLRQITRASEAMAMGNFDQRIRVSGNDEVARLGHSFNAMAVEVARSHQTVRDFVANLSHELKTPITSIQGFSQALVDGTIQDDATRTQAAQTIYDETQRMNRLVGQLLDLARLESRQMQFVHRPLDLVALLQLCRDTFALRADQQQITLQLTLSPQAAVASETHRSLITRLRPVLIGHAAQGSPLTLMPVKVPSGSSRDPALVIYGDPDRLEQVINNLLDNALKYAPAGSTIQIAAARIADETIQISIHDDGPGIPATDLPRIFERFYQVDKSRVRVQQGVGLGLAISREIITAHGGTLTADSNPGEGTTFIIRLPA